MYLAVIGVASWLCKSMCKLCANFEVARVKAVIIGGDGVNALTLIHPHNRLTSFDMQLLGTKHIVEQGNRDRRLRRA